MKKIVLLFTALLMFTAQAIYSQSQADQCETIAVNAGCAAYEAGHVSWEDHYAVIDAAFAACMSQQQ